MRLNNFDFVQGFISFSTGKTKEPTRLAMVVDVSDVRLGHINSTNIVDDVMFRRKLASYFPLSASTIAVVVTKYIDKAGNNRDRRHHGFSLFEGFCCTIND